MPLGTHIDMPDRSTNGWPREKTRVLPVSHVPVRQGNGVAGTSIWGQFAIAYGVDSSTVGMPFTITRALVAVGVAEPP